MVGGDLLAEGDDRAILIRYDGLDASAHEMELGSLAESLRGLSRIIGVAANFAATQKFVQHKDALAVRIVVRPPSAHCFEIVALVKWATQEPLIVTVAGGLTVVLITYIFKRAAGQREEMRILKAALDTAIKELGTRDQATVDRLLDTVDKMAEALRPAAKQTVSPLGKTAATLTVGTLDHKHEVRLGTAEKEAILSDVPTDIGDERTFEVLITELDMETGNCKLTMGEEPEHRTAGTIVDPTIQQANNPYAIALAAKTPLAIRGKPIIKDGAIERLFISDTA